MVLNIIAAAVAFAAGYIIHFSRTEKKVSKVLNLKEEARKKANSNNTLFWTGEVCALNEALKIFDVEEEE